jgi:hypothetical protein
VQQTHSKKNIEIKQNAAIATLRLGRVRDGKPQIIVEHYHQTILALSGFVLGFHLLGGTIEEQAKKIVAVLNESVLDVFVTTK